MPSSLHESAEPEDEEQEPHEDDRRVAAGFLAARHVIATHPTERLLRRQVGEAAQYLLQLAPEAGRFLRLWIV